MVMSTLDTRSTTLPKSFMSPISTVTPISKVFSKILQSPVTVGITLQGLYVLGVADQSSYLEFWNVSLHSENESTPNKACCTEDEDCGHFKGLESLKENIVVFK